MLFDPTEVRSRDELLMGAIATGDSSVIGDPRDRTEEFIKAIADGIGNAGGKLYIHMLTGTVNDTANNILIIMYFQIINTDDTPITGNTLHSNVSRIMSISAEFIGSHVFCYPVSIVSVGSSTRLHYELIDQNSDTKVISSSTKNVVIDTVTFTDTIIAL